MEITRRSGPQGLELAVDGRIDAYWADHLQAAIDDAVKSGAGGIVLDLQRVSYLSSAGIRTLLVAHRELERVGGSFRIERPSEAVKSMLEMAGLIDLLVLAPSRSEAIETHGGVLRLEGGSLEVFALEPAASLECSAVGDPGLLERGYPASACRTATFPSGSFGVGLGAFGRDFDDCRGRFGELLAAGGAAVYLPTDGTNVPDFLIAGDTAAPEIPWLYGLRCSGALRVHARFEATSEPGLTLSALAAAALDAVAADRAGVVLVGETAGLVGAALKRSPALAGEQADFGFPEIRSWISFTSDRAFSQTQALVVGVCTRRGKGDGADAFLRPVGAAEVDGHFHAAAFSYRPLPRGPLELDETVRGLFETEALRGLLHLVNDDRQVTGLGESLFRRGALWAAPIDRWSAGA